MFDFCGGGLSLGQQDRPLRKPAHPLDCRFAIVSDLHVGLPPTIWNHPDRFHLVEVAIPCFEQILAQLEALGNIDFLLLPGDLTQHGEPENHEWLADRLRQLPFPVYVVPGNHDFPARSSYPRITTWPEFVRLYAQFGYDDPCRPYYSHQIWPGLRLIGLNSNQVSADGQEIIGAIDPEQRAWLEGVLSQLGDELVIVMVHHNLVEHLPNQTNNPLGQRYMLDNADPLRQRLAAAGVRLVLTGHLHIQDIAQADDLWEVTTGSLVSYPHPYRLAHLHSRPDGSIWLEVESGRVRSLPGWPDLPAASRQWMGDRSPPFMRRLLLHGDFPEDFALTPEERENCLPQLRNFWADIADGDALLAFPHLPGPVRDYCEGFSARQADGTIACIDNHVALRLG